MKKKVIIAGFAFVVFALFAYICYLVPLAGDDWGYALNGAKGNPFTTAYEFYFSWSGRYFSELSGFILAPNKWLWNIVNPLLFTGIFISILLIANVKKNTTIACSVVLFLMLSVKDFVRMETYTWIMGTANYVIPLFLMLVVLVLYQRHFFKDKIDKKIAFLISVLSFIASMMMENVAGCLLLLNSAALIYKIIKKQDYKSYIVIALVSLTGFVLLRMSPGAVYRTMNEHQAWLELSLFEQIATNWSLFMTRTLLDNKYLILVLSLVMIAYTFKSYIDKKLNKEALMLIMIFALSSLQSVSANFYSFLHFDFLRMFFDITHPLCLPIVSILLFLMIFAIIYLIFKTIEGNKKVSFFVILLLAGASNGAMLLSPIFGARSSLFTIYLLIVLIVCFIEEMDIKLKVSTAVWVILLILNAQFIINYIEKYQLVNVINQERMSQIEYYKDHPEEKEAWIVRMPIMTLHSADVEEWDTYHMDTFKEYYGLNPDMKVIFYYKDQY